MELHPWPFIGRDEVIATCRNELGRGRSVLVSGAAGVGKTQLARELADEFEASRRVVRMVASLSAGVSLRGLTSPETSDTPPLVVIDDIALLDDDTAALVASMVVAGEIVLLATMRVERTPVQPSPAAVITMLWKDDHVLRVDLPPLDRHQLDALLGAALPGMIDGVSRRRLWELTQGSPLFLRELIRSSIDDGSLSRVDGMWRLIGHPYSNRLDELIGARLDGLSVEERDVVELVALGEPLQFSVVLAAYDTDVLDAVERCGLVEVVVDERRRDIRMVHPVFADVARRHLTAARSAAHHARLLELIESTPMRRRDDIVRAATWQLRAGGTPVTGDMVLAARRALYDRNEWLAIELASQAVESRRVDALIIMSQAFVDLGQPERAERLLGEFGGDVTDADLALLAIQRAVTSYWGLGDAATADGLLRDAEATIGPGSWSDELRSERAVFSATQGDVRGALATVGDLLDESKPPRVFVTAAIAGTIAYTLSGRSVDGTALAVRAFEVGSRLTPELGMSDPSIHLVAQALGSSEAGDLRAAEELGRFAYAASIADGHRNGQAWFSLVLGRTLLMRGRPTEATALFEESAATFGWMHSPGPQRWALAGIVQAGALLGDEAAVGAAWDELGRVLEHPARMMGIEVERAAAWRLVAVGDLAGAIEQLADLADRSFADDMVSLGGAVLHDIVRLGGRVDHPGVAVLAAAQGTLAPARAAAAVASLGADPSAFEAVGEQFGAIGADLFAAEMFQRAEALHRDAGRARDATRCRTRAGVLHRATGEDWIVTLGLDDPAGADGFAQLTDREREIAVLAGSGYSNREIADRLYMSVRTVENHLQHVYDKLGVGGRRDLPSFTAMP